MELQSSHPDQTEPALETNQPTNQPQLCPVSTGLCLSFACQPKRRGRSARRHTTQCNLLGPNQRRPSCIIATSSLASIACLLYSFTPALPKLLLCPDLPRSPFCGLACKHILRCSSGHVARPRWVVSSFRVASDHPCFDLDLDTTSISSSFASSPSCLDVNLEAAAFSAAARAWRLRLPHLPLDRRARCLRPRVPYRWVRFPCRLPRAAACLSWAKISVLA